MTSQRPKVCFVAAVPISLSAFMAPHIRALAASRDVMLVASRPPEGLATVDGPIRFRAVNIPRQISLVADLVALVELIRLFRRERFALVQSITPKAGLLAMVAARVAGVPVRIHWFTGQVWATRGGFSRTLLKSADRVTALCATHLLADSRSQRAFLEAEGLVSPGDVTVLGEGSVCGVDVERFRPDPAARAAVRQRLGIPEAAVVALFLGRLTKDKGIPELIEAFGIASAACPALRLLVVGPDEDGMGAMAEQLAAETRARLYLEGVTSRPEMFMAASDLLVLPSHREGFGSTVIEAAACGVPAIGTRIYGLTDAVVDGSTGLLIPVGEVAQLADALVRLTNDHAGRLAMGAAARERVDAHFAQSRLTRALITFHDQAIQGRPS